jgi:hypothetical protein
VSFDILATVLATFSKIGQIIFNHLVTLLTAGQNNVFSLAIVFFFYFLAKLAAVERLGFCLTSYCMLAQKSVEQIYVQT